MDNKKQIRWVQRLNNFQKAFNLLHQTVEKFSQLSDLEKEGMVQRFEYTFELAWKTLKDYQESKGYLEKYPRDVIKRAFETEAIDDGEIWLDMLENRNLMSHTYDEQVFEKVTSKIVKEYHAQLRKLIVFFDQQQ
jgi:nucleotidyltransferase substrate binding protein (TIGR01987 family)